MSDSLTGYVVSALEIVGGAITGNYWLVAAGVGGLYGSYESQKAAMKAEDEARFNRDLNLRSATSPEMIVYGQAWIGGSLFYGNQRPQPGSKDNYEVYVAIAHTGGNREIEDILELYYDNDYIPASDIDWGLGIIDGGRYGVSKSGVWAVNIEKALGTSTQVVSSILNGAFSPDFTGDHRLRGRSYTVHQFNYFSATAIQPDSLFYSGIPSNIRALVKGCKIYDPRLDSTNGGTGSHRFATPSTWEWSDNPILCWTDYMTQFMAVPFAKMDWDWIRAQADICDVSVIVPPAGSPSTYQKRYSCNGVISLANTNIANRDAILGPLGSCPKVSGKWRPTAGAYIAPDVTLTEADYIGAIKVTGSPSKSDRYNKVRGTYFSASAYTQQIDFVDVTDSSFLNRDGEELIRVINLPCVNSEYEAQRIAYKLLLQSDNMITIELKLRWTGLKLAPGVGVSVNYTAFGWTNKVFRVVTWKQGEDDESPVTAVLREDSSGAWDDPAIGAYSTRDDQGVITLGDTVVEPLAVTGFGLDSEPGANKLEWTLPGDQDTVSYYRIYAATSNSFGAANVIWEGHGTSFLHFGVVGTQYWYWIVGVRGVTEGIRAPLAGSPLGSMSTVTGTVLPQATRGAPGQFPYIEDFSDNDYLRFQTEWTGVSATATPEAIVAETGTPAPIGGQYVLEAGNNSGTNDGSFKYLDKGLALPVEDGRLYRMIAVFRKKSGSDNSYFGVVALAADKTTPVGCASNGGNNYYFVRSGYTPSGSAWETHIGYIRTSGGSGDDQAGASTPDDPALLASTAKFIVPVYAVNNSAGTGSYQIGYLALQEVNSDGEVTTVQLDENAATQTASAFDAGPDTYDNGTLPTPYQTLTFTGGMDDQSVVSVHWNSEVSGALSGGAIADVYLKVDWGGGSSYGAGSALIDATTKVLHLNYTWDTGTIPPDTTFSVEVEVSVGAAGGSTVTLESSTLLVEVIKR